MEIPTIEYFKDSKTYVINVGTIKVYLRYGDIKTFDWIGSLTEGGTETIKMKSWDNE